MNAGSLVSEGWPFLSRASPVFWRSWQWAGDPILKKLHAVSLRDPFAVFGMHEEDGRLTVRTFLPWAQAVEVVDATTGEAVALKRRDDAGLFAGPVGTGGRFPYR